jgi:selenocysteine lyase/cysteine desulfurase
MEHTSNNNGNDATLALPVRRQKETDRLEALREEAAALMQALETDEIYIGKNRTVSCCTCFRD